MEQLLNYNQLSETLNVPIKTLQFWVHAGYVPHLKLGEGKRGTVRFLVSDVANWLNTRRINGRKDLNNPLA